MMRGICSLVLAGVLSLIAGAASASCNDIYASCNAGDSAACDAWLACLDGLIAKQLDPVDPPELRRLRELCNQGDVRACDAEIVWRRSIVNGYDAAIDAMNRQFGPDWARSFGLGD